MSDTRPPDAVQAFFAPVRGAITILTRPALWPWTLVPPVLFAVFAGTAAVFAGRVYHRVDEAAARSIGHGSLGAAGGVVAGVLTTLVYAAVALIVSLWIIPPLCAPFMDSLAERVDKLPGKDESVAAQIRRSIRVALAGVFFVGIPQLVLAIVGFVIAPVAPFCLVAAAGLGALGLAYDALDWPLSRRGLGVRERFAWMRRHSSVTLGLGLAVWLVSLVPGLVILALPSIVVGAVSLVNAVEMAESR